MLKGIIYKAECSVNGKCYVGQTTRSLETRSREHCVCAKEDNSVFRRAIRKYGCDSFAWDVLCEIECIDESRLSDMLNIAEVYYISLYNSFIPNGYNSTRGGTMLDRCNLTDEARETISKQTINALHSKRMEWELLPDGALYYSQTRDTPYVKGSGESPFSDRGKLKTRYHHRKAMNRQWQDIEDIVMELNESMNGNYSAIAKEMNLRGYRTIRNGNFHANTIRRIVNQ